MPSDPPQISIIIPVYNGGAAFIACLHALRSYLPSSNTISTEVIVVSDNCTDGSDLLAEEFGACVIRTGSQGGPARARNMGAQQARGDVLFFIDADVTIHSDTVYKVAELFWCNASVAAAIGSYDDAPGAANFLSQYKNLFHHYTHQTACEDAFTFWGACGAVRRQVFWAVGGFDERYRKPSIEDIELGYRLRQHGYQIRLCKTLYVKHLKRWEPLSLLKAEFFYRALPWTQLLLQQGQIINDLNLKFSTRISVALTFALLLTLIASLWFFLGLVFSGVLALALLALNFPVYQFFQRQKGVWFMLRTIPWHWLYFTYSGLAYLLVSIYYYLKLDKKIRLENISF